MKKTIEYKGIQRNTSDINCTDGACEEVINTRLKDGSWRPVGDKEVKVIGIGSISGYEDFTNIYRHSALPANYFVAKDGNSIVLIFAGNYVDPEAKTSLASQVSTEFVISIAISGAFTIDDDKAWIALSKESGSDIDSVTVTIDESITVDRIGTVTFHADSGDLECKITQEGINLETLQASYDINSQDLSLSFSILILPHDSPCICTIDEVDNWITDFSYDVGENEVTLTILENMTYSERTATLRLVNSEFPTVYADVIINQDGASPSITVDPSEMTVNSDEQDAVISGIDIVPSDAEFTVVDPGVAWIISITPDYEAKTVTLHLSENASGALRFEDIRIVHPYSAAIFYDVKVNQEQAMATPISAVPDVLTWNGDEVAVSKTSAITITPDATLTYELTGGDSDKFLASIDQDTNEVSISPTLENTSGIAYEAVATIKSTGYNSETIVLTQNSL